MSTETSAIARDAIRTLRTLREGLAGVTELLLALLDEIDGDCDIEDSDEDQAVDDDRCDVADSGDDEPWLGGGLMGDDREKDDADLEPEEGV